MARYTADGPEGMRCERCGKPTRVTIGSMFNTEMICLDCKEREKAHPDYERARQAEARAVRSGDYNYSGIGRPADL